MKLIFTILILLMSYMVKSEELFATSKKSLESNIVLLKDKKYLVAGGNQFKSLWTRDFCHSVKGLLLIGQEELVKNQLNFLIKNVSEDGLVPLYADSISPMVRGVAESVNQLIGTNFNVPITDKIKTYYRVNGKYNAIDSNLMLLIASYDYYQFTHDKEWWNRNQGAFKRIFDYYESKKNNGLIVQGPHSDWQDSIKRSGKIFLTNAQYYYVGKQFYFMNETELDLLADKIKSQFYSEKYNLFLNEKDKEIVSLEGNLFAIEHNLFLSSNVLYQNLKNYPLYTKNAIPGFANYPSYSKKELYLQVKVSGLSEYHGKLYWSWLMAYAGIIAIKQKDFALANDIKNKLAEIATRDGVISEIYLNDENLSLFETKLYRSEAPFSWGAAYVINFLGHLSK